ncbi:MAG: hypothetical protein LBC75_03515 [Fibromonadaceae bacterium]|jgi:hypothetical protein|nr:hypothetical protein [Fibromonadaceae bacterium]
MQIMKKKSDNELFGMWKDRDDIGDASQYVKKIRKMKKEPAGVDFVIKSTPLTDKDRWEINTFIKTSKAKQKAIYTKKSPRQVPRGECS